MNQEKIGKFISDLRKEKGLTQKELAITLGVTDRAVSKWENGRGMPDVSLLKTLCETLDISINELLSAERIKDEDKINRLEENYINVIDSKEKLQNDVAGYLIFKLVGFILLFIGYCFLDATWEWVTLVIFFGFVSLMICSYKLVSSWNTIPKIIYLIVIFILLFGVYSLVEYDYADNGMMMHPRFYYSKKESGNCILYKTPIYSCVVNSNIKTNKNSNRNNCITLSYFLDNKDFRFHDEDYLDSAVCNSNYIDSNE